MDLTPSNVFRRVVDILIYDNNTNFYYTEAEFAEIEAPLQGLIDLGFFQGDPEDLDGDYWTLASGECPRSEQRFPEELYDPVNDLLELMFARGEMQ